MELSSGKKYEFMTTSPKAQFFYSSVFGPQGKRYFVVREDDSQEPYTYRIEVWDTRTQRQARSMPSTEREIDAIDVSANSLLAVSDQSSVQLLPDGGSNPKGRAVLNPESTHDVFKLAFSRNGKLLAILSGKRLEGDYHAAGDLQIWDVGAQRRLVQKELYAFDFGFTVGDKRLITIGGKGDKRAKNGVNGRYREITALEPKTGKVLLKTKLDVSMEMMAVSPTSLQFAVCCSYCENGEIRVMKLITD